MAAGSGRLDFRGAASEPSPHLERLLRPAMEGRAFSDRAVTADVLHELHTLTAVGPGIGAGSPTRILFVTSPAARARLAPHLPPSRREDAVLAPACAIVGYDREFADQLITFVADAPPAGVAPGRAAARCNDVLQGAYLALAARALGLEAVFIRAFDGPALAAEFFRDPSVETIFVATLGYPRAPPLA